MQRWTVMESFTGRYRRLINHGGLSFWCMFDYSVTLDPEANAVVVSLNSEADSKSQEWFPHLHRGIMRGCEMSTERGRELMGIRIEISKIYTHPIDTTADSCEQYGLHFILDEVDSRSVPVGV